jgi:Zn-dependent peptidase ImmA (M78 family)
LKEHRQTHLPVDIRRIAASHASVIEHPLDPDVSGVLAPIESGKWVILINSTHPETRKRFSIAHELGHLLLHGYKTPHADRAFRFRDVHSSEGNVAEEIQANQFAAELLMPRDQILRLVGAHSLDHAPMDKRDDEELDRLVSRLVKQFEVSKQAMTIRLSALFA